MRVVLDTNVYVSALFWEHGNPHRIIEKALENEFEVFISEEILGELGKVLKRDFKASEEFVFRTLNFIKTFAIISDISKRLNVIKEDFDDNKIIECAAEAKAQIIVSGDNHLLNLKNYNGINIVNAKEFLGILDLGR